MDIFHGKIEDSHITSDLKGSTGAVLFQVEEAWASFTQTVVDSCKKWSSYFSYTNIVADTKKKAKAFRALVCGLAVVNQHFKPTDANLIHSSGLMTLLSETSQCSDSIIR